MLNPIDHRRNPGNDLGQRGGFFGSARAQGGGLRMRPLRGRRKRHACRNIDIVCRIQVSSGVPLNLTGQLNRASESDWFHFSNG